MPPEPSYLVGGYGALENAIDNLDNLEIENEIDNLDNLGAPFPGTIISEPLRPEPGVSNYLSCPSPV